MLTRKSLFLTRKSLFLTRKSLFLTRKSKMLTRKSLFLTRKSKMLTRKSLFLTRKSKMLTRKSLFPTRKREMLTRKALFLTRQTRLTPSWLSATVGRAPSAVPNCAADELSIGTRSFSYWARLRRGWWCHRARAKSCSQCGSFFVSTNGSFFVSAETKNPKFAWWNRRILVDGVREWSDQTLSLIEPRYLAGKSSESSQSSRILRPWPCPLPEGEGPLFNLFTPSTTAHQCPPVQQRRGDHDVSL